MAKIKISRDLLHPAAEREQQQQMNETFEQAKGDQVVKEALKKEKQPQTPADLSKLNNNSAIGTTGGDQRASETELTEPADNPGLKKMEEEETAP